MLRPARLPSPPGWLRRDEVILRFIPPSEDIVIPAFGVARCRTTLGIRLDGRTGNLPSSRLSLDQSQQLVRQHDKRFKGGRLKAHAQLSPDGRWLAYDTNATGSTFQIVVQPFPDAAQGKWQVTSKGSVDTASYIIGRPALFRIARRWPQPSWG